VKEGNRKARTMVKESLRDDNESMRINFGKGVIKVFPGRKCLNFSKCSGFFISLLHSASNPDFQQI
jgi:hypothetical protein